jgi:hypothetical protein
VSAFSAIRRGSRKGWLAAEPRAGERGGQAGCQTQFTALLHHVDEGVPEWLLRKVAHRIADPCILQLIGLWLRAGVLESGEKQETDGGTPQGAGISPLLANIFLYYILDLDLWATNGGVDAHAIAS